MNLVHKSVLAWFCLLAAPSLVADAGESDQRAGLRPSPGQTAYYIDPQNGSDQASGLAREHAWRSFDHVNRLRFAPGDRVEIIAPGSFDQTLMLSGAGTVAAPVEVRFAPGRYDFHPARAHREAYPISNTNDDPDGRKAVGILFLGARHFKMAGQGACLVYRGKMIEVCIDQSEDITVAGLQFDYQRPTVSEFNVAATGDGYVDLRIHKDSRYRIADGKIIWQGEGWTETTGLAQELNPATGELRRRKDPLLGLVLEEVEPFLVRARGKHDMKPDHVYQLRNPFRDCAGVFVRESKDIIWRNVCFRFLHGMGMVHQFSENLTFESVVIAPDPDSGRTTAAWADGLHVSGCRGKLLVKDCVFSGAHDDALNVHGTYLRVVERLSGHQVKVRFMHGQTFGFPAYRAGDEVEFVHADSLQNYGPNRVREARLLEPREMLLTLERPVPDEFRANDVLENVTWTPAVEIRGCTVRHIPTRGFLVSTRRPVLVESNQFFATRMSAILMAADAQKWFESGGVRDVAIRGNTFVRCGEPVINLSPENSATNPAVHQNVTIRDNQFVLRGTVSVRARSTRGLRVVGNMIESEQMVDPRASILTEGCEDVLVEGNVCRQAPGQVSRLANSGALREADICVYGGTSGGVMAAVQAARMGRSVILVSPTKHVGGLTSSGLGFTDLGDEAILGGLSREFYHRLYVHYQKPSAWIWQTQESFKNAGQGGPAFNHATQLASVFEPRVAESVFNQFLAEHSIAVVHARLDLTNGVTLKDRRIVALRVEDGREFRAKMFIDASYEGDLMAGAGVSYTFGREANATYNETRNGIQVAAAVKNQLPDGIDPYVVPGNPASGLLPGVNADAGGPDGGADKKLQAYCYRMALTDVPSNRVMVPKPDGYRESDYELLFRAIAAGQKSGFFKTSALPNRKTDSNNTGGISTDYIGGNYGPDWNWAEASHARREQSARDHERWQRGLIWTLQNHPSVPAAIRSSYARWGLPADEFTDNGHWPHQIYVREARRMVSDYVMTRANCTRGTTAPDSVGLAAYTMDSHHVQRHVKNGFIKNEGDVQDRTAGPYPVSYRSIVPRAGECENLLVPWCLSASHIAFGSIRMEPVFMILSQSAATGAALAIDRKSSVQQVPYPLLRERLLKDGQVLEPVKTPAR